MELASEGDSYGNALAVLAIHAAIGYNDALTISYGELKSTDGQHTRAADLLTEVLKGASTREASSRADQLRAILGSKDRSPAPARSTAWRTRRFCSDKWSTSPPGQTLCACGGPSDENQPADSRERALNAF
jgi:hypothetical protein